MFLPKERLRQQYRTLNWPAVEPALSSRYRGRPVLLDADCGSCEACFAACPTGALSKYGQADNRTPSLDMGLCIFCGACVDACPAGAIAFSSDYRLATADRPDLIIRPRPSAMPGMTEQPTGDYAEILRKKHGIFRRSFKLRQVSAGGCNACEADCNVLGTLVYDLGRFGVDFTASPRHADAIVLTGPISYNMFPALMEAWESVPEPRVLIAVGTCAISGGLFRQCHGCRGGRDGCTDSQTDMPIPDDFRVDMYIPGCPPNPWTILDGLLRARQCR